MLPLSLLILGLFIEDFCRLLPVGSIYGARREAKIRNPLKEEIDMEIPANCSKACPIDAIDIKGKINMNECFYCLVVISQ